jgi:F-type H+-transporting ATPase subunit delta
LRTETIARNYAEALFQLGERSDNVELYADLLDAVAAAVEQTPRVEAILMSPRIPKRNIQEALSRQLGKQVIPAFSVDPEILGGAIVRVGERVLDGSLRRRMTKLRRHLLSR